MIDEMVAKNSQDVLLYNKNKLFLSGITGVESFDESIICATTQNGETLTVEGIGIEITDFNVEKQSLQAVGTFNAFYYDERRNKAKKSVMSKIFGER